MSVTPTTTSIVQCPWCREWIDSRIYHNCRCTTLLFQQDGIKKENHIKDINWKEYVPARPPEKGQYIIIYKNLKTGEQDWSVSEFDMDKYEWLQLTDLVGPSVIVTHYAKLELP